LRNANDIIDEGVDIGGKAGEDRCDAGCGSESEMGETKSDNHDTDKEVVASSEGSEKQNVTEVAVEGEQTVQNNVEEGNDSLFADSEGDSDVSVGNPGVTKKEGTNTVSSKKRIAESDDDNNEDGKRQKYENKE